MLVLLLLGAGQATAGEVLDRVQHDGVVHCGASERPGFASDRGGLAAELCRAIAIAVAGPAARIEFHTYDASFDAVRDGSDELFFLSGADVAGQNLAAFIAPGPVVFIEQVALLVSDDSRAQRPLDLAGQVVCFMIAGPGHLALETALGDVTPPLVRSGFQEEVEMIDAFDAGRCQAMADELTRLAQLVRTQAVNRRPGRIVPQRLAAYPIFAATGRADGAWAADIAWVLDAMIDSARAPSRWRGPIATDVSGLMPGWREMVRRSVGSYTAAYDRSVGELGIAAGPNRVWPDGLLLPLEP